MRNISSSLVCEAWAWMDLGSIPRCEPQIDSFRKMGRNLGHPLHEVEHENPRTAPWSKKELAQSARRNYLSEIGGFDLSKDPNPTPEKRNPVGNHAETWGQLLLPFSKALTKQQSLVAYPIIVQKLGEMQDLFQVSRIRQAYAYHVLIARISLLNSAISKYFSSSPTAFEGISYFSPTSSCATLQLEQLRDLD